MKNLNTYLIIAWLSLSGICFQPKLMAQEPAPPVTQPFFRIPDSLLDEGRSIHIENIAHVNLRNHTWYFRDTLGRFSIEQVSDTVHRHSFRPLETIAPGTKNQLYIWERGWPAGGDPPPLGNEAVWLRLRLQGNDQPHQFYNLYLSWAIDQIEVYEKNGRYIRKIMTIGNHFRSESPWPELSAAPLEFLPGEQKEIFLRLSYRSFPHVQIYNPMFSLTSFLNGQWFDDQLIRKERHVRFLYLGLFGSLIFFFTLLFLYIRDRSLLFAISAIFCAIPMWGLDFLMHLVPPVWAITASRISSIGWAVFVTLFVTHYLDLREKLPFWNKTVNLYLVLIAFVQLSHIVFEVFSPSIYGNWANALVQLDLIFALILRATNIGLMVIICIIYLKRYPNRDNAFIYIVLTAIFMPLVAPFFWILDVFPAFFKYYYTWFLEPGIVTGLFIGYGIVIGQKYKRMLIEKTSAIQDKLSLQQNLNRELEAQVQTRTAELQKKNQRLVKLDQEKTNLINIVAHDLGSPLASIKMYSGIVQKAKDKLTAKHREYLDGISATAQRSVEMIRRILDVNAIDQNGQQLELQQTNVLPILKAAIVDFQGLAGRKDIRLITKWPEVAVVLKVDPAAFRQVIDNLLSNAIKFSPESKTVTVGLEIAENPHAFRIYVRDQGPGIAPEDLPKLFQRYARLSAQPTAGETSTGLGLAIVRQYVEAMDGRVWTENNEGAGATFWVAF